MDEPTPERPARIDAAALARHLRRQASHQASHQAPWLHGEVARRMSERLGIIRDQPRRVLDWWATPGNSHDALAGAYPKAHILRLEPPGFMPVKTASRGSAPWWAPWRRDGVTVEHDDASAPAVQLLWSNMMLHWVEDRPALFARWHAAIEADGFLMFSCFGPDTLKELRGLYADLGWGPVGSPLTDMHDLGDDLVHAGFAAPVMDMEMLTLSWPNADALLTELRGLGANTAPTRHAGLRTPRWRADMARRLADRLADPQGRLRLSFEIIYGHAFRPAPRIALQAETRISLDTMRALVRKGGDPKAGKGA